MDLVYCYLENSSMKARRLGVPHGVLLVVPKVFPQGSPVFTEAFLKGFVKELKRLGACREKPH